MRSLTAVCLCTLIRAYNYFLHAQKKCLLFQKKEEKSPGARALGQGDYSGALRCPRGVKKVRVIMASLEVREKEAFHINPRKPMNTFTAFFTKSCPIAILECQGDIFDAEVELC